MRGRRAGVGAAEYSAGVEQAPAIDESEVAALAAEALKPFSGTVGPGEVELHYPGAPDEPLVFAGPPEVRAWAGPLR